MKRRTVLMAGSAVAAAALALGGCSTPSTPGTSSGAAEITFWHSASGGGAQVVDKAVADFNAANQGKYHVTATYQGTYDDAITKLASAVQAGNLPDVMQVNDTNTVYMVDTGLTVSADELNKVSKLVDPANFAPPVQNYYTLDGTMRSVPFQISQPALFVNPDIAKEAGFDTSKAPATFADLFGTATTIADKTDKAGFVTFIDPWWMEQMTASANIVYCTPGNGVGGEAATAFKLTDPKQIAQWTALQKLYASGAAVNVASDGNAATNSFSNGDSAILLSSSAALGNITKAAKFTPVVMPMPVDAVQGGPVAGGNSVWVLGKDASGAKEQAAWQFAAYLASDDVQVNSFKTSGYLPNTKTAIAKASADANDNQKVLLNQLQNAASSPATAGCHSGALQGERTEVRGALEAILVNKADVATALRGVEDKAASLITEYQKRAGK